MLGFECFPVLLTQDVCAGCARDRSAACVQNRAPLRKSRGDDYGKYGVTKSGLKEVSDVAALHLGVEPVLPAYKGLCTVVSYICSQVNVSVYTCIYIYTHMDMDVDVDMYTYM